MAKISLVVPCWHATKHLPHLLEDLQAQTFTDFEAILVNDGDDSQESAMEAIASQDNRIHILCMKQNGGVASARNAGTDIAKAPWVCYVDPDDRFGSHYLESLYEAVDGSGVDMACGGYILHYVRTGKNTNRYIGVKSSPQVVDAAKGYELISSAVVDYVVWNKLYNLDVMRKYGIRYNSNMLTGDDDAFSLEYLLAVEKIGIVKYCEYVYYFYDGGTMVHRYDPSYMKNCCERASLREKLRRKLGWSEQRIIQEKNKELAYASFGMCSRLFVKTSPLTIKDAVNKINEDILSKPEIASAILEGSNERDRMMRLHQWLVSKNDAHLIALTYKILGTAKSRFGNFYAKVKPFFRGDA